MSKNVHRVIHTTAEHLFWVASTHQWVPSLDLKPGDRLASASGPVAHVVRVRHFSEHRHMLNLTVANLHTYYVLAGNTPVLVHNEGDDPYVPSLRKLGNSEAERYVGDIHEFKQEELGRGVQISRYDVYVDTNNGNIYLNTKNGRAVNAIETGVNRDGAWVDPNPTTPETGGTPACE